MIDAERFLVEAVFGHLQVDAEMVNQLGSPLRLYDELPDPVQYPFISFGRHVSRPLDGEAAELLEHDLSLHVWSRFRGRAQAREVLNAVRHSLTSIQPEATDVQLVSLRVVFADYLRAANGRTVQAVLRLRAVTQNTQES